MFPNGYSYRRTITIDHTKISGGAALTDFPLLISGIYPSLATIANGGNVHHAVGYDLVFALNDDGSAQLDHEIEKYVAATGEIVVWLRMPSLAASSDTTIYLFYGNSSITTSQENPTGVWSSTYKAVYHLKETGNGTAGEYKDSTANANHAQGGGGTSSQAPTVQASGQGSLGNAQTFGGANNRYISVPYAASLQLGTHWTLQAWVKPTAAPQGAGVLSEEYTGGGNVNYELGFGMDEVPGGSSKFKVGFFDGSWRLAAEGANVATGSWLKLDGIWDGSSLKAYKNGSNTVTATPGGITPTDTDRRFIGKRHDTFGSVNYFPGDIDEVRIVAATLSAGWITTEYNNQSSPATFYSLGVEATTTVVPYAITIAGIDRTKDILNQTPFVDDVINDQANTLDLQLEDRSGNGIPATDQEISITLPDATTLFGGYIVKVSMQTVSGKVRASLHCADYTRLLDRNLVHKTYEDMTDKQIIEDIIATYCLGFGITTTNVLTGATIDKIVFNYVQPSQVFRQLADLTGRNWYIDYDKDIHYFPLTTNNAPFAISGASGRYHNLQLSKDATQLKNRIYVRGGTTLSSSTTYTEKGDGTKRQFVLPDKPHNTNILVNGVAKTLGIKNIDTAGYDWYVNYEEKYVEQDAGGTVLTSTDTLSVSYQYDIPILIAQEDTASIAANGVHEFAIFDKTIATTQAARDRAIAELTDYANNLVEGSFETYIPGFQSGQYLHITRTDYDVDADYLVQRVHAASMGAGDYAYTVSIASAKTLGIIKFLIKLLENNRNLIELDPNEVIDELYVVSDTVSTPTESITDTVASPPFVWSNDAGTTTNKGRWNLFQWG